MDVEDVAESVSSVEDKVLAITFGVDGPPRAAVGSTMASTSEAISNSAHQQGQTCIAVSRDGKIAYTGGLDSLVQIWHTDQGEDQEPEAVYEADEGITAVAAAVHGSSCILDSSELLMENRKAAGSLEATTLTCKVSITKAQPAFQPGSTPMENKKCYLAYNMVGVIEVRQVGQGNIMIATSSGDLTFLSGSGMKRIVLGIEGEYVTMAAAEEYVLVVH
ncbi:hypothetical protein EV702DRAFT_1195146 [Suillus placidus]|uniref:Uncharacterized protein n=1 Tax=Suillus placidus TaxID=48579 RepID=A0A9P7D534_9AGAM|nr:hypothetical protein EV702DRAFT_1195146 [Suillus placidus]